MQISFNIPPTMSVVRGIGKVVSFPFVVLFRGLLIVLGILVIAMASMAVALPFIFKITFGAVNAGRGDELFKDPQFLLLMGLSFVPMIIVAGIMSRLKI